jgi:hypothetical protein
MILQKPTTTAANNYNCQPPTTANNNNNLTTTKPQPYYKDKTTIQNDRTTIQQPTCPKTNKDPPLQPLELSEIAAADSPRTHTSCSSSTPNHPASPNKKRHSKKSNTSTSTTTTSAEQQGWISNHLVRDFAGQPGGTTTTKPTPTAVTTAPPRRHTPKPPEAKRRPIVSHSSSTITTKPAAAATDAIPSMDDPLSFCYQEVVRKKTEQEALNTYECEECGKFMDALLQDNAKGVFQCQELMCASYHRARRRKPPTLFWDLSFADELDKN